MRIAAKPISACIGNHSALYEEVFTSVFASFVLQVVCLFYWDLGRLADREKMSGLPVFRFHTKTIQSILDPVAAQVNKTIQKQSTICLYCSWDMPTLIKCTSPAGISL